MFPKVLDIVASFSMNGHGKKSHISLIEIQQDIDRITTYIDPGRNLQAFQENSTDVILRKDLMFLWL
jgi:hypothetical protein